VVVGKSFLIEVQRVEQGRIDWTACTIGNDVGLGKRLEGVDHLQDDVEEDDWREQRDRDASKLLPLGGAVDRGGFVIHLRNLSQSGQEYDHRRTEGPKVQPDQCTQRLSQIGG